ncbi:hypothetical protein KVR01_013250 [Diaporthe batatas]|uniref:uncharacterized protein n=1 Tax=Diaporthe batatas TaxID=748121 RepID=UPI001D04F472|nr:uncharacterized protein KVR01_013250 [Diaporthe batatas]KAG8156837.1 hypothetical protein KVR01_013250 [Diaporthe batatas]
MQFTTAILAFAAASVANAEVLFKASAFNAACVPHGSECIYAFDVISTDNASAAPVSCRAQVQTTDGTLPEVKAGEGKCGESDLTFFVAKNGDGLRVSVSKPVSTTVQRVGSHIITGGEIELEQAGASGGQKYTGPAAFDLER